MQDSRSGAVNGGRSDQGNITVDGVDDNDQVNGFAFTGVLRQTQDSIEEFRVTTGNANAEAGRSSGAQVSLITKSGTNKFHGAAYEYNRPTFTVANDLFNKQAQLNSGLPNRPGKLIRNIFGGDLGGPIFKDKLFFFANYEGSRQAENAQVTRTVPTAAYQAREPSIRWYCGQWFDREPDHHRGTSCDAGRRLRGLQYERLQSRSRAKSKRAWLFQVDACGQWLQLRAMALTLALSFSSPNPKTLNTTIVRLDYLPSAKHRIFARGNLQKDTTGDVEQFPGQGPSLRADRQQQGHDLRRHLDDLLEHGQRHSLRIYSAGYSATPASAQATTSTSASSTRATAETRSTIISVPVNNIVDNLNWTKGKHNIQIGGNWRLVHQNRDSNSNFLQLRHHQSFTGWAENRPIQVQHIGLDRRRLAVSANSYLAGVCQSGRNSCFESTNNYNYAVSSATTGTLLPDGAFIDKALQSK